MKTSKINDGFSSGAAIASREQFFQLYKIAFGHVSIKETVVDQYMAGMPTIVQLAERIFKSNDYTMHIFWSGKVPVYHYDDQGYLAHTFNNNDKRECFFFSCAQVFRFFDRSTVDAMLSSDFELWKTEVEQRKYSISIGFSRWHKNEGDLSIFFKLGPQLLFHFSFNFVPGRLFGIAEPCVILVSCMQGAIGAHALTRQAAKDLSEVAPQTVLMAAINGLAQALEISQVAVVSATNQLSFQAEHAEHFLQGYDGFLNAIGAVGPIDGFFLMTAPFPDKPLLSVKRSHRLRAKARQRVKTDISNAVKQAVHSAAHRATREPGDETVAIEGPPDKENSRVAAPGSLLHQAFNSDFNRLCESFAAERLRLQAELQVEKKAKDELSRLHDRKIAEMANLISRPGLISNFILAHNVPYLRTLVRRREIRRLTRYRFDIGYYLDRYPDLKNEGISPLLHYILHGREEGRVAYFKPDGCAPSASNSRS